MIYVLRLFEVDAVECAAFTSAFDPGGLWLEIAGPLSGHLFTHLLRHEGKRLIFLAVEFWASEEHFARSRESAQSSRSIAGCRQPLLRASPLAHPARGKAHRYLPRQLGTYSQLPQS
jgi:hypothetical protein